MRYSIRTQTGLVLLALVVGFLIFGAWTWRSIDQAKVGGDSYHRIVLAKDLVADVLPPPEYIIESYLTVMLLAEPSHANERDALIARLAALRQEYDSRHEFWTQQALPPQLKQRFLVDAHAAATRFYQAADKEFIPAVRSNDSEKIQASLTQLETEYQTHRKAIDDVVKGSIALQNEVEQATKETLAHNGWLLVLVFLLSVLIAVVANQYFAISLLRGIKAVQLNLHQLAAGNLSIPKRHETRGDELGDLLQEVDVTADKLRGTVAEIRNSAAAVSSSALQLSAATQGMSDTSQHQSDSISSIAANIEEMSVSISEMAGLSGHSQQRAQQSGDQCDKGSEEIAHTATAVEQVATDVKKTSDHVSALGDSSREISSIVSSIRDIADQTNLLALNAAIEAARAGEQGRGFAVVADEVRKLAERTALSTDEISNMIQKIQSDIDSAVKGMNESSARALISIQAVREARTTMNEIAVETRGLVTEMGQMTHSLDEQRHGSNAIAKAVENISADAEMNSTSASRVADTAREMVAIADQLTTSVATFKT